MDTLNTSQHKKSSDKPRKPKKKKLGFTSIAWVVSMKMVD